MNFTMLFAVADDVSPAITGLFALLLAGLIACLALEEQLHAKKSLIAGVFAMVCLLFGAICGVLPFQEVVVGSQEMVVHGPVDGQIITEEGVLQPVHVDPVQGEEGAATDTAAPTGEEAISRERRLEDSDAPPELDEEEPPLHFSGHRLEMPAYIPGIDWGVIVIILGSSLFVDVTSRSGIFTWIAIRVTKASGGDPLRLLCFYGLMTVVFSAVLNNVTAMVIVGSLTAVSLEKLERREKLLGFLLIEGLLTNIGGLLTLISSVPNIIVGSAAKISFLSFLLKSLPFVAVATVLTIWLGARMFGIRGLKTDEERQSAREMVSTFDENDGVQSWGFFWFSAAMLVLFILAIATTSVTPYLRELQMGFVAMSFAMIMLIRYKSEVDTFYRSVDWDLLGFFVALFIVIYVMEHAMVLHAIGGALQSVMISMNAAHATMWDSSVLLLGAAAFSSVTDNIPLSAMLSNILVSFDAPIATPGSSESGLWWAVVFGANLGGNLTPIGSASTLVAVTIIHKHKIPLSFLGFVKQAAPYAAIQIALALVYVLMFLR